MSDRENLIAWLNERRDNCHRIAESKRGDDKAGWLEDAAYFDSAVLALSSPQAPDRSDEARAEPPDIIARCKRIMALIDVYVEMPTPRTRGDIRAALIDELGATPVEARGGPDGDVLAALDLNRLRDGSRRSLDPANQALFDEVWDLRHPTESSAETPEAAIKDRADAERWRAFHGDSLTTMKEPLVNGKTGEPTGRMAWTVYWDGPDATLFRDAIDAAIAAALPEPSR